MVSIGIIIICAHRDQTLHQEPSISEGLEYLEKGEVMTLIIYNESGKVLCHLSAPGAMVSVYSDGVILRINFLQFLRLESKAKASALLVPPEDEGFFFLTLQSLYLTVSKYHPLYTLPPPILLG